MNMKTFSNMAQLSRRASQVALLASAIALSASAFGCNKSSETTLTSAGANSVIADEKGYTPSSVEIPTDKETAITFTRTTDETCAKEVVFPDLKINKPLPLKQPVTVTIPAGPARTITFQCGMGMFKGKVVAK